MTFDTYGPKLVKRVVAVLALLLVCSSASQVQAQWSIKWLAVGKLHYPYLSGGAEPENLVEGYQYPGIVPATFHMHWKGLWISTKNFTDETGKNFPIRTSHIGPRDLGLGEFFDVKHDLVGRFELPEVKVDGLTTFDKPITVDRVDPTLTATQMVDNIVHTSVGVRMDRKVRAWSNPYHENYHIIEYTFTNTGNVDEDPEIELNNTLNDVYFVFMNRPKINAGSGAWDNSDGGAAWGKMTMNDAVFQGHDDYGLNMRAQYSWLGYVPGKQFNGRPMNTLGNPMLTNHWSNPIADDTLGRLGGANMYGYAVLHADASAHAEGQQVADDPAQPRTMTYLESDWSDITTGVDHNNGPKMAFERNYIERGALQRNVAPPGSNPRTRPTQAELVEPDKDFINTSGLPSLGTEGGWGFMNAYGPYTIPMNQQVKIVVVEGVAGLSEQAAYTIGRRYKLSGFNDSLDIPVTLNGKTVSMKKNEWFFTSRDSLFKMFRMAMANYQSGYSIPDAPLPPRQFLVASKTDHIKISWEAFPGGEPPGGWELYRARNYYQGLPLSKSTRNGLGIPDSAATYKLVYKDSGTSYEDEDVERGVDYYYYLQAVGAVNTTSTGMTPTGVVMKSNRYFTQTYEPARLQRGAGTAMDQVRIVPNPWSITQSQDIRFGQEDRLAFFNLPGNATIKIYSELGELIETVEHTNGSGDDYWQLTTSSRQVVVSGIYIAVIKNNETGEQVIRKFIIVR